MKITIKPPKPRNPLAVLTRQRRAGAHDAHLTERSLRRSEKQALQGVIKGRKGEYDA